MLGRLPGAQARRIAYAVSQIGAIEPATVRRIGVSLADELDARPARAFDDEPVARVGAILNYSTAGTRDEVLEGLDETDKAFAEEVRKAIFTFANIPGRVAPRDIPRVLREVDQGALVNRACGRKGQGRRRRRSSSSPTSRSAWPTISVPRPARRAQWPSPNARPR